MVLYYKIRFITGSKQKIYRLWKLSGKMAASSSNVPPLLSKSPVYTDWKKQIDMWSSFTSLEKDKQGAAVLLTLEGAAEEAAF